MGIFLCPVRLLSYLRRLGARKKPSPPASLARPSRPPVSGFEIRWTGPFLLIGRKSGSRPASDTYFGCGCGLLCVSVVYSLSVLG
jgi:hypothetical protein